MLKKVSWPNVKRCPDNEKTVSLKTKIRTRDFLLRSGIAQH